MSSYYLIIKHIHMSLAIVSGLWFAIRGLNLLIGLKWPKNRGIKISSYVIDTFLLLAGGLLVGILPMEMFANGWLYTKLALLVVYIGLGIAFIKVHKKTPQLILFILALLVFVQIYGIARTHHSLGWLAGYV